jgi:hypothetical protein
VYMRPTSCVSNRSAEHGGGGGGGSPPSGAAIKLEKRFRGEGRAQNDGTRFQHGSGTQARHVHRGRVSISLLPFLRAVVHRRPTPGVPRIPPTDPPFPIVHAMSAPSAPTYAYPAWPPPQPQPALPSEEIVRYTYEMKTWSAAHYTYVHHTAIADTSSSAPYTDPGLHFDYGTHRRRYHPYSSSESSLANALRPVSSSEVCGSLFQSTLRPGRSPAHSHSRQVLTTNHAPSVHTPIPFLAMTTCCMSSRASCPPGLVMSTRLPPRCSRIRPATIMPQHSHRRRSTTPPRRR